MFNLIEFALVGFVVFVVLVVLTNTKLRGRIVSFWNRKTDAVADSFGDIITDGKDAIKKASVVVESFEDQIASAMAKIKVAKNQHEKLVAEANKYDGLAKAAIQAGDDVRAKTAIAAKQKAEKQAIVLHEQTVKNVELCDQLRLQLANRKDAIKNAATDIIVQEARQTGLQMREDMLKSSAAFGGQTTNLTEVRQQLDEYEARLDAKDELNGGGIEELERLYSVNTDIDIELDKMKNELNIKVHQ